MKSEVNLKPIGFFRELSHGNPDGNSLYDSQQSEAGHYDELLAKYLTNGSMYIVSPGPVWDIVDGSGPIGTASILTDGEWIWPSDLVHYLKKYHVLLPSEFVKHVMSASERSDSL
jgi:hypothetical protein